MAGGAAFLVGRKRALLPPADQLNQDKMFSAVRIDGITISGQRYHHCTFANVSFKEVTLKNCEFLDCAFVNCYFRKTKLQSSSFVASKFFDCDFPGVSIQACDFMFAHFDGCFVSKNELEHNLPSEPNIKEQLASGLAHAAESLGRTKEARAFRLIAIKAREAHLVAAVRGASTWYKDHYVGTRRAGAAIQYIASRLNGLLWGYGERLWILVFNFVLLTILVFPLLFALLAPDVIRPSDTTPRSVQAVWLSIETILPIGGPSDGGLVTGAARVILALESFTGIAMMGLLVTFLFRSVLRR